ncbi:MAG: hypothetical protein ACK4WM_05225 [Thermoflexales bacterium]
MLICGLGSVSQGVAALMHAVLAAALALALAQPASAQAPPTSERYIVVFAESLDRNAARALRSDLQQRFALPVLREYTAALNGFLTTLEPATAQRL